QEIAAYLITFEKHEEWLTTSPKTRPQNGSMILYNRKKVKYRKDGYCWKKRKDGKTTREDHMKLKVQGVEVGPRDPLLSLCVTGCGLGGWWGGSASYPVEVRTRGCLLASAAKQRPQRAWHYVDFIGITIRVWPEEFEGKRIAFLCNSKRN
ncbi:calmodulin-binding transcription activator 1-like isoform X1, partial [Acipenser oxyrinchus oxyrinchus]